MEKEIKCNDNLRNIAIIAHVDHGKTTLVDTIFNQSGIFKSHEKIDIRAMDSNDLEKERGITILAKCTAVVWKDKIINILDTPGHSDFGSEVERVLMMANGVLLIVDAVEGVMPQTKFVVSKALENKLPLIIFINKIDKVKADNISELQETIDRTLNEVWDLVFDINPDALDSPVFYGSGRDGYASINLESAFSRKVNDIHEILDKVIDYIPAPSSNYPKSRFLTSMIDVDPHLGKILIGKVYDGSFSVGQRVFSVNQEKEKKDQFRISKIYGFKGTTRFEKEEAVLGDIICLMGSDISSVGDMICTDLDTDLIIAPKIDPPTLSILVTANKSPIGGKEGKHVTIRKIKDRIEKEACSNVGIIIEDQGEAINIKGRGELQLSVLMEQMRREGFEFMIEAPKILFKEENGRKMEPQDLVVIDIPKEFQGVVIKKMGERGGNIEDMREYADRVKLTFTIASRFLLGYFSEFMSDTKGTGLLTKQLNQYIPYQGEKRIRSCGVLVSMDKGKITAYALEKLQDRGMFFVGVDCDTYPGMILGEHTRDNDLYVNAVRAKQLTNVRASGKDGLPKIAPPRLMTLEQSITYIQDGEAVEVTPIRICLVQLKSMK